MNAAVLPEPKLKVIDLVLVLEEMQGYRLSQFINVNLPVLAIPMISLPERATGTALLQHTRLRTNCNN
jgi:hypothetical protein